MSLHRIFYFSSSLAVAATVGAQIVVIDSYNDELWFATKGPPLDPPGGVDFFEQDGLTGTIGGQRKGTVTFSNAYFVFPYNNVLSFTDSKDREQPSAPGATLILDYDGPFSLDLSSHSAAAFQVGVSSLTDGYTDATAAAMKFTIYSGSGQSESSTVRFTTPGDYRFPLSQFTSAGGGSPADVASINRITLAIEFPDRPPDTYNTIIISSITAVPELEQGAMIVGLGLVGFGWWRRRPVA